MEYTTKSTNTNPRRFFNARKSLINIANILEFFNLEDILMLSKLSSVVFKYIREQKSTSDIRQIKKMYLPLLGLPPTLNSIETAIQKIKIENKITNLDIVYEFFAMYLFKNIYENSIDIHKLESEGTILNLIKYYPQIQCGLQSGVNSLLFQDNILESKPFNFILSSFLIKNPINNLQTISITNSGLNDDCLGPLITYLNSPKSSVKTLVLNNNEIGIKEKGLDLLKSLTNSPYLEQISINSCFYSSSAVEILKNIYLSNNNIKILTMYYNSFSVNSAEKLFDTKFNNNKNNNKFFAISFKYSPDYVLNNNRKEVNFSRKFLLSRYDDSEFYEIYLENLQFETLSVSKVDPSISYVMDQIFNNNLSLVELSADLLYLCDWSCKFLLKLLMKDKLTKISLSEEDLNSCPNLTKFKIYQFLKTIKDLKNLKILNLHKVEAPATPELWKNLLGVYLNPSIALSITECKSITKEDLHQSSEFKERLGLGDEELHEIFTRKNPILNYQRSQVII